MIEFSQVLEKARSICDSESQAVELAAEVYAAQSRLDILANIRRSFLRGELLLNDLVSMEDDNKEIVSSLA